MKFIKWVGTTMKEAVFEFLAPLTRWSPLAQFRLAIFLIVIVAIAMGLSFPAEANTPFEPEVWVTEGAEEDELPAHRAMDLFDEESHPDVYCIALNVYYESRTDNLAGKYAVADVVLNRVEDSYFPNTICEVVYDAIMLEKWKTAKDPDLPDEQREYYPKRNGCQFSWYCDGAPDVPMHETAWLDAQLIAYNIVNHDQFRGITEGATHYHATYVTPDWGTMEWRKVYHLIGRIGEHIFYKWVH